MKQYLLAVGLAIAQLHAHGALVNMVDTAQVGEEPAGLLPVVGAWVVKSEGNTRLVTVDGSRWKEGKASSRLAKLATAAFPEDDKSFADSVKQHATFPLAIVKDVPAFSSGIVSVRFRPQAGKEDQAGGIAFGIQSNGDYYILRGNALENNLILFQFKGGRRSALKEVSKVPTKSGDWHELRLLVNGTTVTGSLDGKDYLRFDLGRAPLGRVGLWSKADSVVDFEAFDVTPSGK